MNKEERAEYHAEIKRIREDMWRGCDNNVVTYCRVCGGTTSTHYEQPPECDCEEKNT